MKNTESTRIESPSSAIPLGSILFVFGFGLALGHCWWVGDRVASATIVLVAIGGLAGYYCGLWRTIASSMGMCVGYQLANPTAEYLVPFLQNQINQTIEPATGKIISGIVAGLVATLLLVIVGLFLRRNAFLKRFDQYTGFAFGLISATACVASVFWILLASEASIDRSRQIAQQNKALGDSDGANPLAIDRLASLLAATKTSYVMVGLKAWNPFIDVPYFRDLKAKIELSVSAAKNTGSKNPLQGIGDFGSLDAGNMFQKMSNGAFGSGK